MKNKDTNTDYQGDQKWEIVEIGGCVCGNYAIPKIQ